ncbi:MAG TPA: hypothetical protein VJQ52_22590 [Steroidobacteraceae bacterium]|nr:hypothetical protein [Steroidobacteraceae bacterium]
MDPERAALIVSSVVRGAQLRESHGGLYCLELGSGRQRQLIDWNTTDIDVEGRGGDRGLRGIAIHGDSIFVAASRALLHFDSGMRLLHAYVNDYLRHCHEVSIHAGTAYVVSTGFDSVLGFDLERREFTSGLHLRHDAAGLRVLAFDPRRVPGPGPGNAFHLNGVHCDASGIYFSGLRTPGLLRVAQGRLASHAPLPAGTHNAQPWRGSGVVYNDTANDCLRARSADGEIAIRYAALDGAAHDWTHAEDARLARPLFGRGLCVLSDRYVAGGQSPSTITLYDLQEQRIVQQLALSRDVRNAVHGLTVWPFAV